MAIHHLWIQIITILALQSKIGPDNFLPVLLCRAKKKGLTEISLLPEGRSLILRCRGCLMSPRCHQHLGQCEPGRTSSKCRYPKVKQRQSNPCGLPLWPHGGLRTSLVFPFAQIFMASTRNTLKFSSRPEACASWTQQDSSKIVQLMQAVFSDNLLIPLAAVLVALLTATVVEH